MLKNILFALLGALLGVLAIYLLSKNFTIPPWGELLILAAFIGIFFLYAALSQKAARSKTGLKKNLSELAWLVPKGVEPHAGYPVSKELVSLGRNVKNDIMLKDDSVSRKHCEISKTPDGYLIRDLNSKNGTFVNNHRVEQQLLKDGDIISLGNLSFLFKYPQTSPTPSPEILEVPQEPAAEPQKEDFDTKKLPGAEEQDL